MTPTCAEPTRVVLLELLLDVLAAGRMEHRLAVAETLLLCACDLGADRATATALLEAMNGDDGERIRRLDETMAVKMPARERIA